MATWATNDMPAVVVADVVVVVVVVDVCCWVGASFFSGVHDSAGPATADPPLPEAAEVSTASNDSAAGTTDLGLMRITWPSSRNVVPVNDDNFYNNM